MGRAPKVGIIILHWDSPEDTFNCIRSIQALDYPDYRAIVVDNSGSDGAEWLSEYREALTYLPAGKNLGYAVGNNVGIAFALSNGCEYVWLVNDDITSDPDSLSVLVEAAQAEPKAGFLGPKVLIRESPNRILSAGGIFERNRLAGHRGIGEFDQGQVDEVEEVDFLSGSALLVTRRAIETIGMLDEDFFAYQEDVEWCCRGRAAGFKVIYVPRARVWHPDTRWRDAASPLVTYYIARNSLLFARKARLGRRTLARVFVGHIRTLISWSIRPKWRTKRKQRDALALGLVDFVAGRFGARELQ